MSISVVIRSCRDSYLSFMVVILITIYCNAVGQNASKGEIPKGVINVVEEFMSVDTSNARYLKMVKDKLYYLERIESVLYMSKPTTIYIFGNGDPHEEWYYILFIDDKDSKNYSIIGTENNLRASLRMLRDKFYETTQIKGESVNSCYACILQDWTLLMDK